MYIPPSFRITDAPKLAAFMNSHSFATLISIDGQTPFASHLPIRFFPKPGEHGILIGHMARANPQWKHFSSSGEVLAIFHGPHSYISPSWYKQKESVPTWNYATVHAYGIPTILHDHDQLVSLLDETVQFYEESFEHPWPGLLPDEFRDKLIKTIVAFEIRVTRVEGKYKLGQNRTPDDIQGVYIALSQSTDQTKQKLASLMRSELMVAEIDSP